jgi:hypothetical protein
MSKSKVGMYSLSFEIREGYKNQTKFFKYQIININKNLIEYFATFFVSLCL